MRHHDPTTAASPGSRLVARVPADVRAQLEEVAMILTRLTPAVVGALRRIHPLTGEVETAVQWPADLSEAELAPVTDAEMSAALDELGIHELWSLADALGDAHPDRCQG